jgi:L-cysteine/cystine lyase
MTNSEKIAEIRNAFPAVKNKVYLNAGSVGPISTITTQVLHQSSAEELEEGRSSMAGFYTFRVKKAELRSAYARLVNASPDEIALTHHTTDGMNIAIHGLVWQPGDEVITTNLEHPGGLLPVYVLRQRYGVTVKIIEAPPHLLPQEVVARFEAAITPHTRLLVFSHVAWNTGMRLPLKEIVEMAHRHFVLCAVDGAQSTGATPLDLPGSGVDFYAMSGQKWLCGPEGIGALYVRKERLSELQPTFVGYASMGDAGIYDLRGAYMPAPNARRYEVATVNRPTIKAMTANMAWLEESVGWEWIHARIISLAEYARRRLAQLPGVTIITPPGPQAGLMTFNLTGYDPARVVAKLAEDDIIVRFIPEPYYALRISTGFYNNEQDIDTLVEAIQCIQAGAPESLPEFER